MSRVSAEQELQRARPATGLGEGPQSLARQSPGRRNYSPPRLTLLASATDLLEALGPAQANYRGP